MQHGPGGPWPTQNLVGWATMHLAPPIIGLYFCYFYSCVKLGKKQIFVAIKASCGFCTGLCNIVFHSLLNVTSHNDFCLSSIPMWLLSHRSLVEYQSWAADCQIWPTKKCWHGTPYASGEVSVMVLCCAVAFFCVLCAAMLEIVVNWLICLVTHTHFTHTRLTALFPGLPR